MDAWDDVETRDVADALVPLAYAAQCVDASSSVQWERAVPSLVSGGGGARDGDKVVSGSAVEAEPLSLVAKRLCSPTKTTTTTTTRNKRQTLHEHDEWHERISVSFSTTRAALANLLRAPRCDADACADESSDCSSGECATVSSSDNSLEIQAADADESSDCSFSSSERARVRFSLPNEAAVPVREVSYRRARRLRRVTRSRHTDDDPAPDDNHHGDVFSSFEGSPLDAPPPPNLLTTRVLTRKQPFLRRLLFSSECATQRGTLVFLAVLLAIPLGSHSFLRTGATTVPPDAPKAPPQARALASRIVGPRSARPEALASRPIARPASRTFDTAAHPWAPPLRVSPPAKQKSN